MKILKNDFYAAIKRLGPHACLEFVLNTTDEIYQYLNEEIELDTLKGTHPMEFDLSQHYASVTARKMNDTTVFVVIHKKPEGFLGFY